MITRRSNFAIITDLTEGGLVFLWNGERHNVYLGTTGTGEDVIGKRAKISSYIRDANDGRLVFPVLEEIYE